MNRTTIIFAVSLFLSSGLLAADTGEVSLVVVSGRALNNSLPVLESSLGCFISYEEAPFRYPQTITELFPGGRMVPVTRIVQFTYKAESGPQIVIEALLSQYNQQYGDATFNVVKAETGTNIFNVFPVEWKDADGHMVKHESPLAVPVSISVKREDSLRSSLQRILDSLGSPYDSKISLFGPMPQNPMGMETNFIGKSALFCLNEVADKFRALPRSHPVSWSLRRGPWHPKIGSLAVFAVRRVELELPSGDFFISIEAEKPLATAIRILEKALNCTITYEDHEYVFERDMFLNKAKEPQMLSGDMLVFSFWRNGDKEQIIRDMLASFRRYGVSEVTRVYHDHFAVYPSQSYNKGGELVPATAVSRKLLNLSVSHKTMGEALVAYTHALEQETGKRVNLAEPPKEFAVVAASFNSTQEPVMKSLTDLLQSVDRQMSWQLQYSVKSKDYTISIHKRGDHLPNVYRGIGDVSEH